MVRDTLLNRLHMKNTGKNIVVTAVPFMTGTFKFSFLILYGIVCIFSERQSACAQQVIAEQTADLGTMVTQEASSLRVRMFEKEYAPFFEKHPMAPEKKTLIRDAVIKYKNALRNRMNAMSGPDVAGIMTGLDDRKRQFEVDLKGVLDHKIFEALVFYRDTANQREFVNEVAMQMQNADCGLSDNAAAELVRILKQNHVSPVSALIRAKDPKINRMNARDFLRKKEIILIKTAKVLDGKQQSVLSQIWDSIANGDCDAISTETETRYSKDDTDNVIRHSMKKAAAAIFRQFFEKFSLSEQKQELIQNAYANYHVKLITIQKDDRAASKMDHATLSSYLEVTLKDSLNPEIRTALKSYVETLAQRRMINDVPARMKNAECEPNVEIIDKLIYAFRDNGITYATTAFL